MIYWKKEIIDISSFKLSEKSIKFNMKKFKKNYFANF